MTAFLSSVVVKWWLRRFLELGGLVGTGLTAWNNLPPALQDTVLSFLSAKWETITLGSLVPILISLWGYGWSFISTKRPQVVVDGKTVPLKEIATTPQKTAVEEIARSAIEKRQGKTLVDVLRGVFAR